MATYFHGSSEFQAAASADGMQTLYLMNTNYVPYSDTHHHQQQPQQPAAAAATNMFFLNPTSLSHAPPPPIHQSFLGSIRPANLDETHRPSPLHGMVPGFHWGTNSSLDHQNSPGSSSNIINHQVVSAAAAADNSGGSHGVVASSSSQQSGFRRPMVSPRQGLSLSLSSSQQHVPYSSRFSKREKKKMEIANMKVRGVEEEEEEEARAVVEIMKLVFGYVKMAVVKCAIELEIADVIQKHGSPMPLSELTTALRCEPSRLHRIMRLLVHYKIFKAEPIGQDSIGFSSTPLSRRLTKHGEKSMAAFILLESSPIMLAAWNGLSARVLESGNISPFEAANGKDICGFCEANPGLANS